MVIHHGDRATLATLIYWPRKGRGQAKVRLASGAVLSVDPALLTRARPPRTIEVEE